MKRFLDKVEKTDTCWNWKAAIKSTGYGAFKYKRKMMGAHRVSYLLHKGEIADNLFVCHKCDNKICVNPDHLFLGTNMDNIRDAIDKGLIKGALTNDERKHPSPSAYDNGCRCSDCIKLHRRYFKNYYQNNKQRFKKYYQDSLKNTRAA